ncbi:MAG: SDR family NAD(P)-dependent oxidoreductase [Pseudomonadota bacterium]|jgi:NAD(P)-dependent dehydrogenase (short-subunit alcohol dehydrogenase family)
MAQLWGQVAVVTGAARGIGRAIAERYAAEGATLIAVDIDEPAVEGLVAAIRDAGGEAEARIADLGEVETIAPLLRDIARCHDSVDILVNNAAVTRAIDFFSVRPEDWDLIHRVNARGLFFCMQAAAELMRQAGGGRILNIASIAGKGYPATSNIAYAGSKGAVIAMTRIAAHALGRHGINVNAICPGVTRTDLYYQVVRERAEASGRLESEIIEAMDASIPVGRSNEPEDIAALAVFLASEEARNVTGQSWNVDGGLVWD